MSGDRSAGDDEAATGPADASRRATVTTTHADAATADRVAAALRPDNTAEMTTRTEGSQVVTTVERDATGGLASTLDDYVVNATVAAQLTTDSDDARNGDARDDTHNATHDTADTPNHE